MKLAEVVRKFNKSFQSYDLDKYHFLPFRISVKLVEITNKSYDERFALKEQLACETLERLTEAIKYRDPKTLASKQQEFAELLAGKPWYFKAKAFIFDAQPFIRIINQTLLNNEQDAFDRIAKHSELLLGNQQTAQKSAIESLSEKFFKSYENAISACDCVLNPNVIFDIVLNTIDTIKTLKISISDQPNMLHISKDLNLCEIKLQEFKKNFKQYRNNESEDKASHLISLEEDKIILIKNPNHLKPLKGTNNLLNFQIYEAVLANQNLYYKVQKHLAAHSVKYFELKETNPYELDNFTQEVKNDRLVLNHDNLPSIAKELAINLVYQLLWEEELAFKASLT
jgi:hypothetical protein